MLPSSTAQTERALQKNRRLLAKKDYFMNELWLNFVDENGEAERIRVDRESFIIGRHSDNDLSVGDSRLSREHARIDNYDDEFVLTDLDSSNGTRLNGSEIMEPTVLMDGDSINLGGGLQINIEINYGETEVEEEDDQEEEIEEKQSAAVAASSVSASTEGDGGSNITTFLLLTPVLGILILLCVGGGIFIAYSDGNGSNGTENGRDFSTPDDFDEDTPEEIVENGEDETPTPDDTPIAENSPTDTPTDSTPIPDSTDTTDVPPPPPDSSSDKAKIRKLSASFLPKLVNNDPGAFLLDRQIAILEPKINQFKSSSALASNLKQVKQNASQIQTIANGAGLKPQLLAAATLAKLGNSRGDVVATAQKMAGILQKLKIEIGVESADEAALLVAAYYQGENGKFSQMKNTVEVLSGQKPGGASTRQIRTIWFLNKNNKLKSNEFDLALKFLAIGTIMQKPSEFGVNAEPVILN